MTSTLILETSPTPSPPLSSFPPYCYSTENVDGCKPFYSASAYGYRPSIAASAIFMTVFSCALVSILAIGFTTRRWIVFNGPFAVACMLSIAGYAARLASWFNPWDLPLYAVSISFISLVPGFISSSIYFITPCIMTMISNSSSSSRLSPIRPKSYICLSVFDILGLILQIVGLVLSFAPSFPSSSRPSTGADPSGTAAAAIPSLTQAYGPDGYENTSAVITPGFGPLAYVGNPLVAAGTAVQCLGLLAYLGLFAVVLQRRRRAERMPSRSASWPSSRDKKAPKIRRNREPEDGIIIISTTASPTISSPTRSRFSDMEGGAGNESPVLPAQPTPALFLQPPSPREHEAWNLGSQYHHHRQTPRRQTTPFPCRLMSQRKRKQAQKSRQKPLPPLPFRSHALITVLLLTIICLLIRNLYWCAAVFGPGLAGPGARDEVKFTALQGLLVAEAVVVTLCGAHPARFLSPGRISRGFSRRGGRGRGGRERKGGGDREGKKDGVLYKREKGDVCDDDDEDDTLLPPLPPLPPPPPVAAWEGRGRGGRGSSGDVVAMRVSSHVENEKISLRTGSIVEVMSSTTEEMNLRGGGGGSLSPGSNCLFRESSLGIDSDLETGVRSSWSSWGSVETTHVLPRWNFKRYRF